LKYLLDQRLSTIPRHRRVSKLFGYDFKVEFKPGKQNAAADALSRRDEDKEDVSVRAISMPELELFADLRRELTTLQDAIDKRQEIERGEAGAAWSLVDGFIVHNGRIFVPESSALWAHILATAHGVGHEGVQKTLHRLRARSTARTSTSWCATSSSAARLVSATSRNISTRRVFFNPCPFPRRSGKTSQWTSLRGFQRWAANR